MRYFSAGIDASWSDGIGTLDESFVFDDGEQHKRVWTLKPSADNHYIATTASMQSCGRQYARRDGGEICGLVIYVAVSRCVE